MASVNPSDISTPDTETLSLEYGAHSPHDLLLLYKNEELIACVSIHQLESRSIAILSNAETLPEYQRRGTFWRFLGIPVIRMLCDAGFERIEAMTWPFNRKGIPVYKRFGFRAVPGTSLQMVNYLPSIIHHLETRSFFERHDYIRRLQNERSYGYDDVDHGGTSVFEYTWKKDDEALRVLVDFSTHEIVQIEHTDGCLRPSSASAAPANA